MKFLPIPDVDDDAALDSVVDRNPLAQCPHIDNDSDVVRDRYAAYETARANPFHPGCPSPISLLGDLGEALPNRYDAHGAELNYIEEIRDNHSPFVCPMCGAPKPRTVDHVFPQNDYPDLAIFSKNLVPACSECNRGHQHRYKGEILGERILHPYFDRFLRHRIVQATITPANNSYEVPVFDLEILLKHNSPLYTTVDFHVRTVVKPAGAIKAIEDTWVNLQRVPDQNRLPHVYFQMLPIGNFTNADFDNAVDTALALADFEFHTPNNWKSMLFAGLANNPAAKAYLAQTIRRLRANPAQAADI
jgi:hypothetical protein